MRPTILLSIGAAATLALAACSTASGAGATSQTNVGAPSQQGGPGSRGGRFGGFPGVSGLVADVTGSTAQVQTPSSQTAVTWTSRTRFSQQRATTAAAVKVGDCVIATSATTGQGASSGATTSPTTPPTIGQPTSVAATSVEILSTTSCAGPGRLGDSGTGRTPASGPSGIPTPRPTYSGGQRNGGRFGAVGQVTATGPSSFTVRSTRGPANAAPRSVTVTWSGATRFTTLGPATASAVKVGLCLSAAGKADTTGAVSATTITVSPPVNGSCVRVGAFGRVRPGAGATTAATLNG